MGNGLNTGFIIVEIVAHQVFTELSSDAITKSFCCDVIAVGVVGKFLESAVQFNLRIPNGRKCHNMLSCVLELFPVLHLHLECVVANFVRGFSCTGII